MNSINLYGHIFSQGLEARFENFDGFLDSLIPDFQEEPATLQEKSKSSVEKNYEAAIVPFSKLLGGDGLQQLMDFMSNWPEERSQSSRNFIYTFGMLLRLLVYFSKHLNFHEWFDRQLFLVSQAVRNYYLPELSRMLKTSQLDSSEYFYELYRLRELFDFQKAGTTLRMEEMLEPLMPHCEIYLELKRLIEIFDIAREMKQDALDLTIKVLEVTKLYKIKSGDEVVLSGDNGYRLTMHPRRELFALMPTELNNNIEEILTRCYERVEKLNEDELKTLRLIAPVLLIEKIRFLSGLVISPLALFTELKHIDISWQMLTRMIWKMMDFEVAAQKHQDEDEYLTQMLRILHLNSGRLLALQKDRKAYKRYSDTVSEYIKLDFELRFFIPAPEETWEGYDSDKEVMMNGRRYTYVMGFPLNGRIFGEV